VDQKRLRRNIPLLQAEAIAAAQMWVILAAATPEWAEHAGKSCRVQEKMNTGQRNVFIGISIINNCCCFSAENNLSQSQVAGLRTF